MKQPLEEFITELKNNADDFRNYWLISRSECNEKDCWPLELDSEQWFEMFIFYQREENL